MKKILFIFRSEHSAEKYNLIVRNVSNYGFHVEQEIRPTISRNTARVFCGNKKRAKQNLKLKYLNSHDVIQEINSCSF